MSTKHTIFNVGPDKLEQFLLQDFKFREAQHTWVSLKEEWIPTTPGK